MYIWLVLATFMTLLYSFNLSIRGDMRQIRVEPIAQTVVSQLTIQHRSSRDYIRAHTPPANGSNVITYTSGELGCDTDVEDYLPYGYNCESGFKSEIYCMKKTDWSQGMADCSSPDAMRYLVTYGSIPHKWLNLSSNTPTNDLLNAIRSVVGMDTSLGYAMEVTHAKYKMVVKGREDNVVFIPNYVVSSGGFKTTCVSGSRRCLVYVTPFE